MNADLKSWIKDIGPSLVVILALMSWGIWYGHDSVTPGSRVVIKATVEHGIAVGTDHSVVIVRFDLGAGHVPRYSEARFAREELWVLDAGGGVE